MCGFSSDLAASERIEELEMVVRGRENSNQDQNQTGCLDLNALAKHGQALFQIYF